MYTHEKDLLNRPISKRTKLVHVTLGLFIMSFITYSPNIKFPSLKQLLQFNNMQIYNFNNKK